MGNPEPHIPFTAWRQGVLTASPILELPLTARRDDADGNAGYEAHVTKADGSLVRVYVDTSYAVASVEAR